MNTEFAKAAVSYKHKEAGAYMLVEGAKLNEKISGEDFCVTRKMDGIMQLLFCRDGKVEAYSTNGTLQCMLPCINEFASLVEKSGIKNITVAAELYATIRNDGRERVCDVATAIADDKKHGCLHLAPFDIIDIEGEPFVAEHYKQKFAKLNELFKGELVRPVDGKCVSSKAEVVNVFNEWVTEQGSEGLVVHCELPFVYKVKPRHTIDAAIIGYTLGEDEHETVVRDILLAVMTEDGHLQQFAVTGNGFNDQLRHDLLQRLATMHTPSEYIETDSRNVAFQMVRPEIIVEVSVVDLVAENSRGEAKMNMLLCHNAEEGYHVVANTPGVAAHCLVFERIRDDKHACYEDIRLTQLTDLCPFSEQRAICMSNLDSSEILLRRVFTKGSGEKLMVQKFMVIKTNKEQTGIYPAYVLHYTDFSISRKEQLKKDIRVSNSLEQIMQLAEDFVIDNVKKGWNEIR